MIKLDVNEKREVQYCIPDWLKNEQIKQSTARFKGRIEPVYEKQTEPIALVAFGPSLNDTWEKIKDFKYIMTCSGSHKFLIDRGIIPTYHVEVDPRKHKIELLGTPHKDVTYLISSSCHPKYFDWLEAHNANIKIWHVFDTDEAGFRLLPFGDWALTGGASVGLRTMSIARFLGFTDFHIFGMDGCKGESGYHSSIHPNAPKEDYYTEYDGKTYYTTPSILEVARQTFIELDQLKDVNATFYGNGLVQDMSKHYVKDNTKFELAIGISKPPLISEEYKQLNIQFHKDNLTYGSNGLYYTEIVLRLYNDIGAKTILDYGCGKGYLAKTLPFPIWEYDPCVPGKEESPRPADLVICTNVLEHVEPDYIELVLKDIHRCTLMQGYFVIATSSANKILPDGRNTHLIQQGMDWWRDKIEIFFDLGEKSIVERDGYLYVMAIPIKI